MVLFANVSEKQSNFQEILSIPLGLVDDEAKIKYIVDVIIPAMDERRGRATSLSEEEVAKKLWSVPASDKPGEYFELEEAIIHRGNSLLTHDVALEVGDMVYYYLQPNAPEKADWWGLALDVFTTFGEMSFALDFAIVKYQTRLKYGDADDYKKIEEEVMQSFFEIKDLPECLYKKNL